MSNELIRRWRQDIDQLEREIEKLELITGINPNVQKQIKTYRKQIAQKEFEIILRS